MTGLSLRDIVNRTYHKSGQTTVAEGLIHFLDEKLLGSDEPVIVSEVRCRVLHVFEVYKSFCYEVKDLTCRHIEISAALKNFKEDKSMRHIVMVAKFLDHRSQIQKFCYHGNVTSHFSS